MKAWKQLSGALLLSLSMFGVANADQLADIQQKGVLKVAVPQDFPPFGSVGADMQPHGYDIDMAGYLANKLNVKLELIPVTSANRIPYLQTKKVDLVISSLGKNPEREKVLDFSNAYAPFFLGVFGAESIAIKKADELANKTIGVTRGAVEDMELSKIAPASTTIKRFEDNNTTLSAYLSGQIDLIATGNVVVADISSRMPNRKPLTKFLLKNSPCYIGIYKGETRLQQKVNELINDAHQDGSLNKFSENWLKAPLPADL
ncbi:transporter substrate-binding domain-containing protein [Tolumonas lignilytica]|uniref:transporter substrate-binding domain-containing protein n=1 Tax=Tolumonas lignilytica TaxID=1283284 RepID=UPI0004643ADF|nr:transporter substrate-binding domain-containing protein [Tolumonas lignilytica]